MQKISEQEAADMADYIMRLNSAMECGAAVAVEGKRDADALRRLGCRGEILEFHRFGGTASFVDHAARYRALVLLFDRDAKGRQMTSSVSRRLERRMAVDTSLRRRLWSVTRGRVMFVEQLVMYEDAIIMMQLPHQIQ